MGKTFCFILGIHIIHANLLAVNMYDLVFRPNLGVLLRKTSTVVVLIVLFGFMVGSSGLEPPTSRLSGVRSNRLSYEPSLAFCSIAVKFS